MLNAEKSKFNYSSKLFSRHPTSAETMRATTKVRPLEVRRGKHFAILFRYCVAIECLRGALRTRCLFYFSNLLARYFRKLLNDLGFFLLFCAVSEIFYFTHRKIPYYFSMFCFRILKMRNRHRLVHTTNGIHIYVYQNSEYILIWL